MRIRFEGERAINMVGIETKNYLKKKKNQIETSHQQQNSKQNNIVKVSSNETTLLISYRYDIIVYCSTVQNRIVPKIKIVFFVSLNHAKNITVLQKRIFHDYRTVLSLVQLYRT